VMEQGKQTTSDNDLEMKLLLLGLSHIDVATTADLMRLKLPLVRRIGFQKSMLESNGSSTEVLYSDLAGLHLADTLACLHALKKALDCPKSVAFKRTENNSAQQEMHLIGSCFADVPLRISALLYFAGV
jgi:hypothetical protein